MAHTRLCSAQQRERNGEAFAGLPKLNVNQLVTYIWSNMWQLKVNINKCHVLPIRRKSINSTSCQYLLDGFHLNNVSITSDLGGNIDSNLSFKSHINIIITRALQLTSWCLLQRFFL